MKQRICLVLVFISIYIPCIAFAEQKILFCADSFSASASFRRDQCMEGCAKTGGQNCVQSQLDAGWNIVSSAARKIHPLEPGIDCTCEGMEYVLNKEAQKSADQLDREKQRERAGEKERLTRESELCVGRGCPALPTVAECVGWLGAFMLADSEIFNRKDKGIKSSAGTKPQGEATASVSNHPMFGQVKALAEKFGGENLQITINQKIKPEIQKLFPQIAADFPEKSEGEKTFIALQLIEKNAAATCADAGENGIRFISIAKPANSTVSGETNGASSISKQSRQIDKNQVKDTFREDCRAYAKSIYAVAEARDNRSEPSWEKLLELHPILREIEKREGRGYTYVQLIRLGAINKNASPNSLMRASYDSCLNDTGMCMLYNRGCGPDGGK